MTESAPYHRLARAVVASAAKAATRSACNDHAAPFFTDPRFAFWFDAAGLDQHVCADTLARPQREAA